MDVSSFLWANELMNGRALQVSLLYIITAIGSNAYFFISRSLLTIIVIHYNQSKTCPNNIYQLFYIPLHWHAAIIRAPSASCLCCSWAASVQTPPSVYRFPDGPLWSPPIYSCIHLPHPSTVFLSHGKSESYSKFWTSDPQPIRCVEKCALNHIDGWY